jgi:hypothetical protein
MRAIGEGHNKVVVLRIRVIKKSHDRPALGIELVGHAAAEVEDQSHRDRTILL